MDTSFKLRNMFLDYFERRGHKILKSAPIIPLNDKSILFVNSGMAPMKQYFLKQMPPPAQNISNIQVCVRAGGKHNDLDDVGYTARHHTLFEMCGNFSFGGYDGNEAIMLAYGFLTLFLDKNRLWATVHPDDLESAKAWKEILGSDEKVVVMPENTWSMGEEGPCGMCTEIFYDHGEGLKGDFYDGERFVEVWNIVKMTHEVKNGIKSPLQAPCIDTGAGLERLVAAVEGTHNSYKAGFFKDATQLLKELTGKEIDHHHRIIADHGRAILFLATEGVRAGNCGREYVMRRLIRRAALSEHGLGTSNLITAIIKFAAQKMGQVYSLDPEAAINLVEAELKQFKEVCENGLIQLRKILEGKPKALKGEILFKLYDTYGLPLDIVKDQLRNEEIELDLEGFEAALEEAKERSKTKQEVYQSCHGTDFVGYDFLETEATVLEKKPNAILLNKTPFYPEGGGQKADKGVIRGEEWVFIVEDVQKSVASIWHYGAFESVECNPGDKCAAIVDKKRRLACTQHHSATHLLLAALRKIVDKKIRQKGSLVDEDRLRFDFTCDTSLQLEQIEEQVNVWIQENLPVDVQYVNKEEASLMGAVGEFEEKYGEVVRILTMAESIEFCGGTHVSRTGDIGGFYITKKSSAAAGIARIEAVAGLAAFKYGVKNREILQSLSQKLSIPIEKLATFELKSTTKEDIYEVVQQKIAEIECSFLIYSKPPKSVVAHVDKILTPQNLAIAVYFGESVFVAVKTKLDINVSELLIKIGLKAGGRRDFAQGGGRMTKEDFFTKLKSVLISYCQSTKTCVTSL